jgi:hypothetical protein
VHRLRPHIFDQRIERASTVEHVHVNEGGQAVIGT